MDNSIQAEEIRSGDGLEVCYAATPDGIVWYKPTKDGPMPTHLTNFEAKIIADILIDNGAESWRMFNIEAQIADKRTTLEVPADRFAAMKWPAQHLGAEAIIYSGSGIRDRARTAIQIFSVGHIQQRFVYAHLGWQRHNDQWIYLHADGAIGESGTIDGMEVQVDGKLSRYILPAPPRGKNLKKAIKKSLDFLKVAPEAIGVPLYGAIWRAPLTEGDLSLHLVGRTGQGKSSIAALAQQHFGPTMEVRDLPANWTNTPNALEELAFAAKDVLMVIDEFTPTNAAHAQTLHRVADRIFRAQANRTGRQRMGPDARLRAAKPPRGLIVSTGEESPRGESLRARMLLIDVAPDAVDFEQLTRCQKDALGGYYAQTMAAYVQWLAPWYADIQAQWQVELAQLRQAAARAGQHRRTAGTIASLALGLRYFFIFAWQTQVLSEQEAQEQWQQAWTTLQHLADAQDQHQRESEPTERFLSLLREALASGRAYLKKINEPDQSHYTGQRMGWVNGDRVYLLPDVSYAVAQRLGEATGNGLAVTSQTLRKRLNEKGLLAETEPSRDTLLVRKQIDGTRWPVLVLNKEVLYDNQPARADQNHQAWSGSCPPLVGSWTGFLDSSDHDKILNKEYLYVSGQGGQVLDADKAARDNQSSSEGPALSNAA